MRSRFLVLSLVVVTLAVSACGEDTEKQKQALLAGGNGYAAQKKFAEATIEYKKALQVDARFGEAHYRLALAYDKMGDRPNALRELVLASDLLPERDEVQLKAGQYLLFAKRFDEARRMATRMVDRNRRNVDAQLLLANAYAGLNQLDAATAQIEEAIQTEPTRDNSYTNLAAVQIAVGNPEKAEAAFRNAMTVAPRAMEPRAGLANLLWARGKVADAEKVLKEALTIEPANALVNRTLATIYLTTGRAAQAEAPLKVVADSQADSIAPRLALADYYLASKRVEDGTKLLEAVAKLPDGFAPASARLADFEYKTGKPASAHARVDKLIAGEPKNPLGYLMKAAFLTDEGKREQALARAKEAASVAPRLARAQYVIGMIQLARRNATEAAAAFAEAVKLSPRLGLASVELAKLRLMEGRTDEAVQRAADAVRDLPTSSEARYVLVRALMSAGQLERARQEMASLMALAAGMPRVQTLAGLLALQQGDRAAARKALEQALKLDPGENEAIGAIVGLDLEAGRKDEARRRVEARRAAAPRNPGAIMMAAQMYDALGMPREAEAAWKQLLELDASTSVTAYEALARLYLQQQRPEQALAECDRIIQRQPRSVAAHTLAGLILQSQGKTAEAQRRYEKALELDPQAVMAANNLAWLYAESGVNLETAMQLAQTAKAAKPDSPEVSDTLGWVAYRKGLFDAAVPALEQAVKMSPDRAAYRYHLGMAYLKANDWSRARASLQEALRLRPDFAGVEDARKALASIQ